MMEHLRDDPKQEAIRRNPDANESKDANASHIDHPFESLNLTSEQQEAIKLISIRAGKQIGLMISSLIEDLLIITLSEKRIQSKFGTPNNAFGTKKLLTASEVSKILNITGFLAYKLIQDGEITSVNMGRTVRVRPEYLDEFIKRTSGG